MHTRRRFRMGRRRRRLSLAGAILLPILASLGQLPLIAHADPNLSAPMHMSAWRETVNLVPPSSVVHIFGEVSNSGTDARFVRVACKLYNALGNVLASESTLTELDILKQNELSPFDDIFFNPSAAFDHFTCQLAGGAGTTSLADHNFTTTVTSTATDQLHVTGTVVDNKNLPVDRVRVIFTFYNSGIVVDVDSLMANNGDSLAPGIPASFELDRTADRPVWDAVTAISEAPFPAVQLPTVLAFADQIQGTTSAVNNLVLTNIGTGGLHVAANGVSISGTNAADFAIAQDGCSAHTVAPDATCTVGLTFTPGGLGGRTATVSVSDDAAATPQSATLNGNGLSRAAATISPQSLAFGDQVKGTNVTQAITVTSVGPDPVLIGQALVSGLNAAEFLITGDTCSNRSIAVNATCTVSITFTPANTGARSASLAITDDGRFAHDPVSLTGNGTPVPPTTAQASFDPSQLAFGNQLVGTSSQPQQVMLTSTGTADLLITLISISVDSADYKIESDNCPRAPTALHPTQTCTISITFKPIGTGPHNGTLTLADNAPGNAPTVGLTGTGVTISNGPTISSWGRGRLDVFMKGADGALWHKFYDASIGWQGWSSLGAPSSMTLASDPVAISWGNARIDIFVRGSDNALWHKYYDINLGGWSTWYSHGGLLTSGPTATSWGYGRLDVFYRGSDNTLRHIFYAAFIGAWSSEYSHGGGLASDPSAVTWAAGRIDVVARGADGTLQHNDYDLGRGGWLTAWESLGGALTSRPTITTWGPGRLDVFAQGTDRTLQHTYFYAGNWQGWTSQGSPPGNQMTSDPGAIAWSAGRLDIFVRGQSNTLLHKFYDSSVGWSTWFSESLLPNPG